MNQKTNHQFGYFKSPIGLIKIITNQQQLISLTFVEQIEEKATKNDPLITETQTQLANYFNHKEFEFHLPISTSGSKFQQQVWNMLLTIKYGETITYQQLASKIKKPTAARAVGSAVGKNPLSIIIPCHRVVSANPHIINYGWGKAKKIFLLNLEQKS